MNSYVSNRVLKINVGFLLAAGPGNNHDSVFDVPTVRVSDDLTLEYVRGPIRMSRTAAGILVQGQLETALTGECYRCLDSVTQPVTVKLEELFTYPASTAAEFSILEDAVLDLAPLLRAEVMIAATNGLLCRPDCKGLCPECGTNWNHATCTCGEDAIDPRLAGLKHFLE
ncbi:MAG: DUF177 domain-containing protein [Anaerolineae bacterium]